MTDTLDTLDAPTIPPRATPCIPLEAVAQVVHEATRAYLRSLDASLAVDVPPAWAKLPAADREALAEHVIVPILVYPIAPASAFVADWSLLPAHEQRVVILARSIVRAFL